MCQHNWQKERTSRPNQGGGKGHAQDGNEGSFAVDNKDRATYANTCSLCNAWRGELGLEPTFQLYIDHLIQIFGEVKRILKPTGTIWVNLGDSYSGSGSPGGDFRDGKGGDEYLRPYNRKGLSAKSLCCIPDRFKIAMVDSGWVCRNEIIWYKRNCMPSSASDRFTVDFEKIYFFTRQGKYWFEQQFEPYSPVTLSDGRIIRIQAGQKLKHTRNKDYTENSVQEPSDVRDRGWASIDINKGRNMRTVWQINTSPYKEAHFAVFPEELPSRCIKAGCPKGGVVLDPFMGSGTSGVVAKKLGRNFIGIELNPAYIKMAEKRIADTARQGEMEL